jgi:uncharacterized protein YegP (UPF0339 family)
MRFILYIDVAGYWRWRLVASNGKTVADSAEGYYNRSDALHGISLVRTAYNAPVYE